MQNMEQLKKMQKGLAESIREETGIPVEVVNDFPSFYNFQVQFLVTTPELFSTGLYFDFYSTGGRIHYEDYSGQYGFDQTITQMTIGGIIEKNFFRFAQVHFISVILKGFVSRNDLKNKNYLLIDNSISKQIYKFNALSVGMQPALGYAYKFYFLSIGLELGYKVDFSGLFHLAGDENAYLVYNNQPIHPQWDGLNISLTLGLGLFSNSSDK